MFMAQLAHVMPVTGRVILSSDIIRPLIIQSGAMDHQNL
jgi:hypothetical protein